jgi:hypothetical protein
MAESTMAELKTQFVKMQREINATLAMLKALESTTEIVSICPPYCAPLKIVDPPRTFEDCEIKMIRIEGAVTVGDTATAIDMLSKWTNKMIQVLNDVDPGLPLP